MGSSGSGADHHHFVHLLHALLQLDGYRRFPFLQTIRHGRVTHIRDHQHVVEVGLDGKHAVGVGHGTDAWFVLQGHRGTDDGLTRLVDHMAAYLKTLLSPCCQRYREE